MVNPHIRESWPENLCSLVAETVGVWTLCGSLSGSVLIISDLPLVCLNSQSNKILLILYFLILLSEFILAEKKVSLRPVEWTRLRGVLIARAQSLPIKGSSTLSPFRQFIVSSLRRLSLFSCDEASTGTYCTIQEEASLRLGNVQRGFLLVGICPLGSAFLF